MDFIFSGWYALGALQIVYKMQKLTCADYMYLCSDKADLWTNRKIYVLPFALWRMILLYIHLVDRKRLI